MRQVINMKIISGRAFSRLIETCHFDKTALFQYKQVC